MTRCARTANGATRREWSRQLPGTPRPPSTRAATPTPPNDALWGESRHDHPDAPARRRGHPWPLEHASAVPTIAGHGAQRAVHNPAAEAHATSTRRSDDQKPCSGRNLDRESPPIIHGAPALAGIQSELESWPTASDNNRWDMIAFKAGAAGAGTCPGGITHIQTSPTATQTGGLTVSLPAPSVAGNLVVISWATNSSTALSVPSGSWTQNTLCSGGVCEGFFYLSPIQNMSVQTVALGCPAVCRAQISEWSNVSGAPLPRDRTRSGSRLR